jgi:hypothetical protein
MTINPTFYKRKIFMCMIIQSQCFSGIDFLVKRLYDENNFYSGDGGTKSGKYFQPGTVQ